MPGYPDHDAGRSKVPPRKCWVEFDIGPVHICFQPLEWMSDGTGWLEAFSAVAAIWWAIWLGLINLGVIQQSTAAGGLSAAIWIPTFVVLWALHSLAMCGNIAACRFPSALLGALVWAFCGGTVFFASPSGYGGPLWLLLSLMMVGVAFHSGKHAR